MKQLEGKVAVVTGGNSGIGFAMASRFAAEGAAVVIVGRRADAVDAAVKQLGEKAVGVTGDIADLATHDRVAALVAARFGGADIYVANAGMNQITPSEHVGVEEYDVQFATNTRAVFFGVQKMAPLLRANGSILLVSSIASGKALDGHAVYAGSKAAIEAFARSWALEFKARGIRVNVISPGPVDTPILAKLGVAETERAGFEAMMAGAIPLGRLGRPGEVANAAFLLASPEGSFITGVNLRVDGGIALA
ncbi:SDR family NAD(P)-dependent oxidoreductase [Cupriavidus agavae]|uniref:NAD(P)-dependent dehydrogenase (Short-subunit alcohol dehydrogenase family) n=1 Tax=Cupriavidus agavae TaxID=1001822 RepID=A0A4Q7S067_9BURK|nr:SDR family oxidoreductase [Cupriavidus agavae]RZT39526.1 NAD(P)-dependent dehydrogenase (short-subunit alcohol dehydrogenase family) [Cupriavidus agavae]